MMKRFALSFGLAPAALLSVAALSGCGQNIEKNTLFRDQQKIVARLDDDTKRIGLQVEDISVSLNTLKQDLREIKNNPRGALTVGGKDLDQRLKSIEVSVAEMQKSVNEQTTRVAKLEIGAGNVSTPIRRVANKPEAADSDADSAPAEKPAKGKAAAKAATKPAPVKAQEAAAKPKPAKPRGSYYQVKQGETAEMVAQTHRIPVSMLLAENHIPAGRSLFAGQQIYVPAGEN